jgi:hypothetical protein
MVERMGFSIQKCYWRFAAAMAFAFLYPFVAFAANSGITYHGRILKPDGITPVSESVQFKMQIRTPDNNNCLMYEESQTQDLNLTNGSFSITIGDGSGSRTDSSGYSMDEVFANRGTFSFPSSVCNSGAGTVTFTPGSSDGRSFVVSFKGTSMSSWESLSAQGINFSPLAIEARQVGGFPASSLLRVENGSGPQAASSLTPANFTDLTALINGTSSKYVASGANGAPLPLWMFRA